MFLLIPAPDPPVLNSKSRDKEFCCVVSRGFSVGRVPVACLFSPLWLCTLYNLSVMLLFCLVSHSKLVLLLILELFSQVAALNYLWIRLSPNDLCFLVKSLVSSRVVSNTAFHQLKLSSFWATCCSLGPSWAGSWKYRWRNCFCNSYCEQVTVTFVYLIWLSSTGERTGYVYTI